MLFNLFSKKIDNDDCHSNAEEISFLIPLIGGRENIVKINNCATRLRLEVKDINKIKTEDIKKYYPAVQKINDKEVHIIVGTNASIIAELLRKIVDSEDGFCNRALVLMPLVGGRENIVKINNCATRLRLEVKDVNKIKTEDIKKYYPAVQKINDKEVHIVVGTDAEMLANELKDLISNNSSCYFNKSLLFITLLGGIENIVKINNCATRLRLEVKDINKIDTEEIKKYYSAVQKINDNEIHIVVGTDANLFAGELKKLLGSYSIKTSLILPLVGGIENISKVNNCATRLRLEVKDINKINIDEIKKYYSVVQKINDNEIHIVVGIDANLFADEFRKFVI